MSEAGSKFGMLRNLQQAITEDKSEQEKQESAKDVKQKSTKAFQGTATKAEKQNSAKKQASPEIPESIELKHYSSYMPMPVFARLQIYVAKQKAVRGRAGNKVSIQSVITEAVQQYLEKHDK